MSTTAHSLLFLIFLLSVPTVDACAQEPTIRHVRMENLSMHAPYLAFERGAGGQSNESLVVLDGERIIKRIPMKGKSLVGVMPEEFGLMDYPGEEQTLDVEIFDRRGETSYSVPIDGKYNGPMFIGGAVIGLYRSEHEPGMPYDMTLYGKGRKTRVQPDEERWIVNFFRCGQERFAVESYDRGKALRVVEVLDLHANKLWEHRSPLLEKVALYASPDGKKLLVNRMKGDIYGQVMSLVDLDTGETHSWQSGGVVSTVFVHPHSRVVTFQDRRIEGYDYSGKRVWGIDTPAYLQDAEADSSGESPHVLVLFRDRDKERYHAALLDVRDGKLDEIIPSLELTEKETRRSIVNFRRSDSGRYVLTLFNSILEVSFSEGMQ